MTIQLSPRAQAVRSAGTDRPTKAMIAGVAHHMAEQVMTSLEVEEKVRASSPNLNFELKPGTIERLTGVHERRVARLDQNTSDFAAAAARKVLHDTGTDPADIDLLIFSSSCHDISEPATVHIVQALLGTNANVFDLKNACNSFLSAIHVAEAFLAAGTYKNVLICTGECPTRAIRWEVEGEAQWRSSFPGYTVGDGGAAMLLRPATDERGIWFTHFGADSEKWPVMMVPGGGSRHGHDMDKLYFEGDGGALRRAVEEIGARVMPEAFIASGVTFDDFDAVCIHQVSVAGLDIAIEFSGIGPERWMRSVPQFGNISSVTLPLQLDTAIQQGTVGAGSNVLMIGLAAGVSMGVMMVTL
ncbi:MAG: Beta-ketoacyl-acyl-carrier-protein synthase [Thermoleophilia bacterium]|nr:Beta-ketoacyl-acyl-carrier-protein synthase [Thermoleophilia bacterium]